MFGQQGAAYSHECKIQAYANRFTSVFISGKMYMRIIKVFKKANGLELMGCKSTTALNDIYLSLTLGSDHFNSLD